MPPVTKVRQEGTPYEAYYWKYNRIEGTIWYHNPFRGNVSYSSTRTGINNPGWRSKIKRSIDATTDLDGTKRKILMNEPGDCSVTYMENVNNPLPFPHVENVPVTYYMKGTNNPVSFQTTGGSLSAAEQLALMKLYKRIRADHQRFSGLTFLGELRQAVSMVKKPAKALQTGLSNYLGALKTRSRGVPFTKKGNLSRKRILADTWLEYSFGWKPLISDIQGAAEALADWKVGQDGLDTRRSRISATGEDYNASVVTTYDVNDSVFASKLKLVQSVGPSGRAQVVYRVRLKYDTAVPTGSAGRLAQLSGFTLLEFIPTAWELLPWSFLIDYFSNIGDVLEAFATPTNNVYSITRTTRQVAMQKRIVRLDASKLRSVVGYVNHKDNGYGTGSWITSHTVISRRAVSSLALPKFEIENPFGKNAWNRSANMAALLAGARPLKPFYR